MKNSNSSSRRHSLKIEKKRKVNKILFYPNFILNFKELKEGELNLSDEELYYIALSIGEMQTLRQKRFVFDIVHVQCDPDSINRFMEFFSDSNKHEIMLSC